MAQDQCIQLWITAQRFLQRRHIFRFHPLMISFSQEYNERDSTCSGAIFPNQRVSTGRDIVFSCKEEPSKSTKQSPRRPSHDACHFPDPGRHSSWYSNGSGGGGSSSSGAAPAAATVIVTSEASSSGFKSRSIATPQRCFDTVSYLEPLLIDTNFF